MCSNSSFYSSLFVNKESLYGHQQKALYYWWGGLRVQLQTCLGRSVEWLEPWWAKHTEKCSLVRLQIRSQQGGVDRCRFHGGKTKDWTERFNSALKRRVSLFMMLPALESNDESNACVCTLICFRLWNYQPCFPLLRQALQIHSASSTMTTHTVNEKGPAIGSGSSQSQFKGGWVTGKHLCLPATTWYFTCFSSEPGSH